MTPTPSTAADDTAASLPEAHPRLLGGSPGATYPLRPSDFDELFTDTGTVKPHWQTFVDLMAPIPREELLTRREQARRLIRENGITYNVYDDPAQPVRAWDLDLLPLLVDHTEWAFLEAGLTQRARLLDAFLADVYGPQRVLSESLLPPELLFANQAYLRPCRGVTPPAGRWLHLYAAEVVRLAGSATDRGGFCVLADRTQTPSGAGYTLENRIVLSRTLPGPFAQCNVLRLAPFFIQLRRTLASLAPPLSAGNPEPENPRVVLLTPGPFNETYFEQAYLARYLGYTLVQGSDLTVRDGKVFLKTLGGLQRVDVILRRVDDSFCDPLELYAQSYLGVPGLLQAVRDGTVTVANALGSGVAEFPALLRFLPTLCRALLGEELRLPSIDTFWCGHPDDLARVLSDLPSLVVLPACRSIDTAPAGPIDCSRLSKPELATLAEKIRARPAQFVAHPHPHSSQSPAFPGDTIEPRRFAVRTQLAATPDGYTLMPGGLTRFPQAGHGVLTSLTIQKGGGTKDTWVVGTAPVAPVTLLAPVSAPLVLTRGGGEIPSRVADDLFWLGRYVQRAQSITRLARCLLNRLMDANSVDTPEALALLAHALTSPGSPPPALPFLLNPSHRATTRQVTNRLFGPTDDAGLLSTAKRCNDLSRVVRDRISVDTWRILQSVQRDLADFVRRHPFEEPVTVADFLSRLITAFLAFEGLAAESMTRGQLWRFLDMGMRIERALNLARLLQATLLTAWPFDERPLLESLLDVADSTLTYRRRYLARLEVAAVADLLIADDTNPRSLLFQARLIDEHLAALPHDHTTLAPGALPDVTVAGALRTRLASADLVALCLDSPDNVQPATRPRLADLLAQVQLELASLSESVGHLFFTHAAVTPRPLSPFLPPSPPRDP